MGEGGKGVSGQVGLKCNLKMLEMRDITGVGLDTENIVYNTPHRLVSTCIYNIIRPNKFGIVKLYYTLKAGFDLCSMIM